MCAQVQKKTYIFFIEGNTNYVYTIKRKKKREGMCNNYIDCINLMFEKKFK